MEMWIDIPGLLGHEGRQPKYNQIALLQPDCVAMMNSGLGDGRHLELDYA